MDASVRVVVANRPRLLRELVLSTLSGQAGIEVVGEAENEQDVPSLVAATKPDFLLIALEESRRRPPLCDLLLREYPALRIIAVAFARRFLFVAAKRGRNSPVRRAAAERRSAAGAWRSLQHSGPRARAETWRQTTWTAWQRQPDKFGRF